MTILSYSVRDDMIVVTTDNVGRNQFVYPADKFSSIEALSAEIDKSISFESKRKTVKDAKSVTVKSQLDFEVAKDK